MRDAIVYQIVILGEAAKATTTAYPPVELEVPTIEWSSIARMRDKVTHHYWALDHEIVWSTASQDVPRLREELERVLNKP